MARVIRLPGLTPYAAAHALSERLVEECATDGPDVILLLEHPDTITLGRARGADTSVLSPDDVPVTRVERGGDATWHGPGQLVAYPIVALDGDRRDVLAHLRHLEDAVSALLRDLGLTPTRDPRNTGVWLPHPAGPPRKVCSIGVAVRRWVTWHGLALNVSNDPLGFARIRPCGFDADVMTRLVDHLQPCPSVDALAAPLARHLVTALGLPWDGRIEIRPV